MGVERLECRALLAGDLISLVDQPIDFSNGDDPTETSPPNPGQMFVSGIKWEDYDADGIRDGGEPGIGGVTIYSDINRDGLLSDNEPFVVTQDDGDYFMELHPGEHVIREVVPTGFRQTFPPARFVIPRTDDAPPEGDDATADEFATVDPERLLYDGPQDVVVSLTIHPTCLRPVEVMLEPSTPGLSFLPLSEPSIINGCGGDTSSFEILLLSAPAGASSIDFVDPLGGDVLGSVSVVTEGVGLGGHHIFGEVGEENSFDHVDFGNHREREPGAVQGRKWLDQNGDGVQGADEVGLGGVVIFADMDRDGRLDRYEPHTTTQFDDPATDADEEGLYRLDNLTPGFHVIREVVPDGTRATFPLPPVTTQVTDVGRYTDGVALELRLEAGTVVSGDDGASGLTLDFSVLWPDGCGMLDAKESVAARIGNTVAVELRGYQTGTACTEALEWRSITVDVDGGLPERSEFQVFASLHEELADPNDAGPTDGLLPRIDATVATLVTVGKVSVSEFRGHAIEVASTDVIDGVDFGNFRLPPGDIRGSKWLDANGNGRRDADEPGLAGVTIYSDINRNGIFDSDEPSTKTLGDDPTTEADETGTYVLSDLAPGQHEIREVVPDGYVQTFPPFLPRPTPAIPDDGDPNDVDNNGVVGWWPEGDGSHYVNVPTDEVVTGINFGNRKYEPAEVHGMKWHDRDGDGQRDDDEPGIGGVAIYADIDFDGVFSPDFEPFTTSMYDDPQTHTDETGFYRLSDLAPGGYVIREVVPDGFVQTFPHDDLETLPPIVDFGIPFPDSFGGHWVYLGIGDTVGDLDFGNRESSPATIEGRIWEDANGNGIFDGSETGLDGVSIYLDRNFNGHWDANEPTTVSGHNDLLDPDNGPGQYRFDDVEPGRYAVREIVPRGFAQTFPRSPVGIDYKEAVGEPIAPEVALDLKVVIVPTLAESNEVFFQITFGGCSHFDPAATQVEVDGNEIAVDLLIHTEGNDVVCDAAIDEVIHAVDLDGLGMGEYVLRGELSELQPDGRRQTSFVVETVVNVENDASHVVYVAENQSLHGIDFGNRRLGATGSIWGTVWDDANRDGIRNFEPIVDRGRLFIDTNMNGEFDDEDRVTEILDGEGEFGPVDDFDPYYEFTGLEPGTYIVRMVPSNEYDVTSPSADIICLATYCTSDMQWITVDANERHRADFGIAFDSPQTAVWNGTSPDGESGEESDWDNPQNWTFAGQLGLLPPVDSVMGSDIVFSAAGSGQVDLGEGSHRMAHSLRFDGDYDLVGSNTVIELSSERLYVGTGVRARIDAFVESRDGLVRKQGAGQLSLSNGAGRLSVDEGTLVGRGDFEGIHVKTARLAPGDSIGAIHATMLRFDSDATLEIELGDDGDHDLIESELALLDGTLEVQQIVGTTFGPRGSMRTVPILQASGALHGEFHTTSERHLGDGVFFDVHYSGSSVDLSVMVAGPGDANGDGRVDTTDLGVWRENKFSLGSWVDGDFSGDGFVDGEDFNIWLTNRFRVDQIPVPTISGPPRAALANSDATDRLTDGAIIRSVGLDSTVANTGALDANDTISGDSEKRQRVARHASSGRLTRRTRSGELGRGADATERSVTGTLETGRRVSEDLRSVDWEVSHWNRSVDRLFESFRVDRLVQ